MGFLPKFHCDLNPIAVLGIREASILMKPPSSESLVEIDSLESMETVNPQVSPSRSITFAMLNLL